MTGSTVRERSSSDDVTGADGRYAPIELPSRHRDDADSNGAPVSGPRLVRTVTEAAAMLGISRAFAYRLVKTGELHHIRLGRRVLVPYKAILELVDGHPTRRRDATRGMDDASSMRHCP